MSSDYHMDCAIVVFVPDGEQRDRIYILLEEMASSNVFDDQNRLCPSWSAVAIGQRWQVMAEIVERSSNCEGGMLKFRGRDILPEGYIKRWRDAIKKADAAAKPGLNVPDGFGLSGAIQIPDDVQDRVERHYSGYPAIKAVLDRATPSTGRSGTPCKVVPVKLGVYDDIYALAEIARDTELALYNHLTVHGPKRRNTLAW